MNRLIIRLILYTRNEVVLLVQLCDVINIVCCEF